MKNIRNIALRPIRSLVTTHALKLARRLRFIPIHRFAKLTGHLLKKEIIFKSPPFNKDLVKAISLISPQYILRADKKSRTFWEIEQNACCWGEDQVLSRYLSGVSQQKKILEVGPGLGRSVVFIAKRYNWQECNFHLYESSGIDTKYTTHGPRFTDSFCGNTKLMEEILIYNGIRNYKLFDAKDLNFKLDNLPGPYDVIYSFYAVGFHWSLEHFIDEIAALMHQNTLAFFIVSNEFAVFEKLKAFNFKIIDYTAAYKQNEIDRMLVLSKSAV